MCGARLSFDSPSTPHLDHGFNFPFASGARTHNNNTRSLIHQLQFPTNNPSTSVQSKHAGPLTASQCVRNRGHSLLRWFVELALHTQRRDAAKLERSLHLVSRQRLQSTP